MREMNQYQYLLLLKSGDLKFPLDVGLVYFV